MARFLASELFNCLVPHRGSGDFESRTPRLWCACRISLVHCYFAVRVGSVGSGKTNTLARDKIEGAENTMVIHKSLYSQHTAHLISGRRYLTFLERVSELVGQNITPATMRTESDVITFVQALSGGSVKNYKTVLRHYVAMVKNNNL
jgi:hypothetical protein